jgi:hypothetical protein
MAWPRTIRFRYSLRALLVFLTLLALWGGYHANRAIRERKAEEVLARRHASFMYGPKLSGQGWQRALAFGYQRLVQLVWRERFITYVSLSAPLDSEVLGALEALPHVEEMILQPRGLSKEDNVLLVQQSVIAKDTFPEGAIAQILSRPNLTSLGLSLWILSDDDCTKIAKHQQLKWLGIDGSLVTEDGFSDLVTATDLRHLSFRWCHVTGEKLKSVPGSKSLELVECEGAPVGVEFARFIARSPNVSGLAISSASIDDEFVARISDHPSLASINLTSASVTDRCIPDLIQWKSLSAVALPGANISHAAIEHLTKSRPDMRVNTYGR